LKTINWVIVFLFCSTVAVSQTDEKVAYGLSAMYDFQSNGLGIGARAYIPWVEHIAFSPQIAYYPPFNSYHEIYIGGAAQYTFYQMVNWHWYALGALYYDRWFNSDKFEGKVAKPNNIAEELGVGIKRTYDCFQPFAEARYDFKWKEYSVQVGFMISFGDCFVPFRCSAY
jgi:hypothetical protein